MLAAIEANLNATNSLGGTAAGIELHVEPDLCWFISPEVPTPLFNHVYSSRLPQEGIDARIDEILSRFAAHQLPLMWSVGPFSRPSDLGLRLQAHGLSHAEEMPGMALDLHSLNEEISSSSFSANLAQERVSDDEALREYIEVVREVFELPQFAADAFFCLLSSQGLRGDTPGRHYIGWLDGKVVASATHCVVGGVAGIYNIGTLPEVRRQGVGTAMSLGVLRKARKLGYRIAILQSSAAAFNVYRRLGFAPYSTYSIYMRTG